MDTKEYIRITQIVGENDLSDVAHLEVNRGTWDRIKRIFGAGKGKNWKVGDCWVEPETKEFDLDLEDPITISNDQSFWLLRDFFKCKPSTMKRFKKVELDDAC